MAQSKYKTIGRSRDCDLVLDDAMVSREHARVERSDDGRLFVQDNQSLNGLLLCRSKQWIRADTISLCRGDHLRLGNSEIPAEQLAGLFGPENRVWLPAVPQVALSDRFAPAANTGTGGEQAQLKKPRRNPVTGQIEENYP